MADELDPQLDPEVEARVLGALAGLRPDADPAPPVPPAVWARMERALAHESGLRTGAVVELAPRRRMLTWAGPLVAVSAVVLGIVVMTNLPGRQADVVADGEVAVVAAAAPKAVLQAGFVPPAMTVVDSAENFTPDSLRSGVTAVLEKLGVTSVGDLQMMASASPAPDVDLPTLRECVTELTQSPTSQALIVIRASYDGAEAGVVVIPAVMMGDISTVDMSQISDPTLHIFVVGPQCGAQPAQVISHVLHAVGQ